MKGSLKLSRRTVLVGVALALLLVGGLRAVTIAPMAVYLDGRNRSTSVTLFNSGERPEEVQIAFAYGIPQSDSMGEIRVDLTDSTAAGVPSAAKWVRAFPQRMVLQPGQRQVVRVLAEPPAGVQDGEYWARMLVKSKGGQAPIEQRQGNVSVSLDIETVLAIALVYRQGAVTSGLDLDHASAVQRGDTVVATVDVTRTGNAAFVGRLVAELMDAGGSVVEAQELPMPVHYQLRRVVRFMAPSGAASVRIRLDNVRSDLPDVAPLPMASPIVRTLPITRG